MTAAAVEPSGPRHLRVVTEDADTYLARLQPMDIMPEFEGQKVFGSTLKLTSTDLEMPNYAFKQGEIVKLVVEARVVRINHSDDNKDDQLMRNQILKAIHAAVVSWDVEVEDLKTEF